MKQYQTFRKIQETLENLDIIFINYFLFYIKIFLEKFYFSLN